MVLIVTASSGRAQLALSPWQPSRLQPASNQLSTPHRDLRPGPIEAEPCPACESVECEPSVWPLPGHGSPGTRTGALWSVALLAALAALPSLVPAHGSDLFTAGGNGAGQHDGGQARQQAWLRGREAAKDAAAQRAAAQQAVNGAGAAGPVRQVPQPADGDAVIPEMALRAYREAESWAAGFDPTCKLRWSVLAGIRDTDSGRWDGDVVWDRAVGPMQFIASTWQSLGRDGNGDGLPTPTTCSTPR